MNFNNQDDNKLLSANSSSLLIFSANEWFKDFCSIYMIINQINTVVIKATMLKQYRSKPLNGSVSYILDARLKIHIDDPPVKEIEKTHKILGSFCLFLISHAPIKPTMNVIIALTAKSKYFSSIINSINTLSKINSTFIIERK